MLTRRENVIKNQKKKSNIPAFKFVVMENDLFEIFGQGTNLRRRLINETKVSKIV